MVDNFDLTEIILECAKNTDFLKIKVTSNHVTIKFSFDPKSNLTKIYKNIRELKDDEMDQDSQFKISL